jgi:uncharacterized protein involved in exopolysaccharide biosynthesis
MEARVLPRDQSFEITLRDLAAPLFRRWRILLGTFLCVFGWIAWAGFFHMHKYTSHTILAVRSMHSAGGVGGAGKAAASTDMPGSEEEVRSLAALLASRDLLQKVVIANDLERPTNEIFSSSRTREDRIARAVRTLASDLKVEVPRKTNLIKLSYSSSDPGLAFYVLSSLSDFFISQRANFVAQEQRALPGNADVREVRVAVPPAMPVLPANSTAAILLLATILATVATALAGYLMHTFDPVFHNQADVIDVLGISVVEAIPKKTA